METPTMEYLVICLTSLSVAALTLFSGFGLGTLLLPAFALFFPVELAVTATAVVHLFNNLLKAALVGRWASWRVALAFTVPALITSTLGAMLLLHLGSLPAIGRYSLFGKSFEIEAVKLTIGVIIGFFSLFDLIPKLSTFTIARRFIPVGGALSGFFGGISGLQGALRSLFLIRAGLTKEQFIGTSVVCSVVIDLSRLSVYGNALIFGQLATLREARVYNLMLAGTIAALIGTVTGAQLVKKITLTRVQQIVAALLIAVATGLCAGWI